MANGVSTSDFKELKAFSAIKMMFRLMNRLENKYGALHYSDDSVVCHYKNYAIAVKCDISPTTAFPELVAECSYIDEKNKMPVAFYNKLRYDYISQYIDCEDTILTLIEILIAELDKYREEENMKESVDEEDEDEDDNADDD